MSIQINNTGICIRPSSVDGFQQCAYQWAKVFLEGHRSIPNNRAAIGTAIHRGIEVMWNDAILAKRKDVSNEMMVDASIEEFDEIHNAEELRYDNGESQNTAHQEIIGGIDAYIEDCLPFLDIPQAVETRFDIEISGHPVVAGVGGTVDYLADGIIDDVKTSKRKPVVSGYVTQQSLYKHLAIENGHNIKMNRIQGVVLTKQPKGMILEMEADIEGAKIAVNTILDTIEYATKDLMPIDLLFRCNTKYWLCSPKYCNFHGSCPATKRHTPEKKTLVL